MSDTRLCSLRLLAQLLVPCCNLSVLDLGHLHWAGDSLEPLVALPSLQSLAVGNISQLGTLGNAVPLLARLTALQLAHCPYGTPGSFCSRGLRMGALSACSNLQLLKLPECGQWAAPAWSRILSSLTKLTHLELHLKSEALLGQPLQPSRSPFPSSLSSSLVSLELWDCEGVVSLPPLPQLGQLTKLVLHSLSDLTSLLPLSSLSSLQQLRLDAMFNVGCLAPLSHLTRLMVLNLGMCGVGCVEPLAPLTRLTTLKLMWVDGFVEGLDLRPLESLSHLRELCVDAIPPGDQGVLGVSGLLEHMAGLPFRYLVNLTLPLDSNAEACPSSPGLRDLRRSTTCTTTLGLAWQRSAPSHH